MDPSVAAVASSSATRPYVTRPELLALGYGDRDIRDALRSGAWRHLRVGTYAPASVIDPLAPAERSLLAARACVEKLGDTVALSHTTALVAHGAVPDGVGLDDVHLLRLDGGGGRRCAGVVHHAAAPGAAPPVQLVGGLPVVAPAYAVRQVAASLDQKRTLGLLDRVFHLGIADEDAFEAVASVAERWPGSARFRLVLPLADRRVASFGESYVRWICKAFRLPMPGLQRPFCDEHGVVWAYTDFDWLDGRHLGEFDGRIKYTRYLREGEAVTDVVERERQRENRLRATGAGMTRFVWNDVLDRNEAATAARIAADLEQSRRLYVVGRG